MNTAQHRGTDWKQRYLDLLDQNEKQQARSKRKQKLLVDAVVKLVQFGRNLDDEAEDKLLAMRGLVRQESFANVDLAHVVEALEAQLDAALKNRKGHQHQVAQELTRLTKRVQGLSHQKDLKHELARLQKAIEARPLQLSTIAVHLVNLNQLHDMALKETRSEQSLLQRWFGQAATQDATHPTTHPTAQAATEQSVNPDQTNAADTLPVSLQSVSDHLSQLLREIDPGDSMQGTFEIASELLANGLTIENIDLAIQSVTDVVLAAISRDRQEMTGYLSQMNERLQEATIGLTASQKILNNEVVSSQQFGDAVQASMGSMREEVEVQQDLGALKSRITQNLDDMMLAVETRQQSGNSLQTELSDQLKHLVERAQMLEAQGQEAERRVAEQRQRALTDTLTGLPNREAYEETAAREVQRWQRYGRPLCLAVCDIDLFKTVNDSHGHVAGDEVLKQIAQMISQRLRGTDFVARYGGEEFVVLLPETDKEAAEKVMDSVREAVEMCQVRWEKKQLQLTISVGIADFKDKDILQSAFTRADRALYQAKMNGRNRVEVAMD